MLTYAATQNVSLLVLRIITAAIFYVAAYYKFSYWSVVPEGTSTFMLFITRLLSIAEPLGATALLMGFLTRWAAAALIIVLLGAIYVMQFNYGVGFVTPTSAGWNMPLATLGCCLALLAFGPGSLSLSKK